MNGKSNSRYLKARWPVQGPELLRYHRVARLRFVREHANWTHEQWANHTHRYSAGYLNVLQTVGNNCAEEEESGFYPSPPQKQ